MADRRHAIPLACLSVFLVVWVTLAIDPLSRKDWWLENALTFVGVALVAGTYRYFRFSDRAYVQGTLFLILHTIGSHYTYSHVPLGDWIKGALHVERNHTDRVAHFAFGLLMLSANRELLFRSTPARRGLQLVVAVMAIAALSAVYEIVEWLTAIIVDPEAGTAFLGTQGDPWDAQKDIACALVGSGIAATIEAQRLHAADSDR